MFLKPLNRALMFVLGSLVALVPFVVAFRNGNADPFLFGITASSMLYQSSSHIPIEATQFANVPGLGFLMIILGHVTGVDLETVLYLPIAGPFFTLMAFILARRWSHSSSIGLAIAIALGYRWLPPTLSTVWPHTFGFGLYLLFVATYLRMSTSRKWAYVSALWMLYLGIHFFSYTAEVWTIAFLVGITLINYLRRDPARWSSSSLLLALVVTFFGFTQIVYIGFIPGVETTAGLFGSSVQSLLSLLFRASAPVPNGWVAPATPLLILVLQVAWYLALMVPPAALVGMAVLRRHGPPGLPIAFPISGATLGFAMVWPVDALAYALLGQLSIGIFRYSTLGAALLTTPALQRIQITSRKKSNEPIRKSLPHMVPTFLVVASIVLFASATLQPITVSSVSKYSEVKPSAEWLLRIDPGIDHIVSDHITQGEFGIEAAKLGRAFDSNNLYVPATFQALLGEGEPSASGGPLLGRFVVVNVAIAQYKTSAGGWVDFEPLEPHLPQIASNPSLSLIYDDGNSWVLLGVG